MSPDPEAQPPRRTGVRLSYKLIAYIAAWVVALVATNPAGNFWALAYIFPLGLVAFVNLRWGNDGGWGLLIVAFAVYVLHAIFYFRAKTWRSATLWFAVLVILLVCNVAGCRSQLPK